MITGIIYLATNQINGKVYVGQTTRTVEWRKRKHYNRLADDDNAHFHNALRKYKRSDWTWEILKEMITNTKKEAKEILTKYEKYYIRVLDSKNRLVGYNGTEGGDGVVDPSDDVRYEMGKSWRGKKLPKKMKNLMSESHKGKPCPENAKIKIGNALRGKSNWWKGRPKSAEQKEKMRQSALRRYATKEII
jgi:group I intron endonuclease